MCLLLRSTMVVGLLFPFTGLSGYGQSEMASPAPAQPQVSDTGRNGEAGIGVKLSSLGVGIDGAVRVAEHANVRAGFNMIRYDRGLNKDGIDYQGQLNFQTIEAHLDYFPWVGSFHIGPGVLVYAADPIAATGAVPPNRSFMLGGTTFYSDPANPATANGKITFYRAAPMVTVGRGNLVSRTEGKHFSVPFEFGLAFQGLPKTNLSFAGRVCDQPGVNCRSVLTDATVQTHIVSEQNKISNDMSFFKVYPIISVGIGYRF